MRGDAAGPARAGRGGTIRRLIPLAFSFGVHALVAGLVMRAEPPPVLDARYDQLELASWTESAPPVSPADLHTSDPGVLDGAPMLAERARAHRPAPARARVAPAIALTAEEDDDDVPEPSTEGVRRIESEWGSGGLQLEAPSLTLPPRLGTYGDRLCPDGSPAPTTPQEPHRVRACCRYSDGALRCDCPAEGSLQTRAR